MGTRVIFCLALLCAGCTPAPTSLSPAEVQDFVKQYVAANKTADAKKMMAFISREPGVSSAGAGMIYRGLDAVRTVTDESIAATSKLNIALGTIDVTPLAADTALAVASMIISPAPAAACKSASEARGAMTMIVKRTPEGLRLIHEHYSLRPA